MKWPRPWSRSTSTIGLADAAVEPERLVDDLLAALVADVDGQARDEERGLPHPVEDEGLLDRGVLQEDLQIGPEAGAGPGGLLGDLADLPQARLLLEPGVRAALVGELAGQAAPEADRVGVAVAVDLHVHPRGQGVDHGGADAVQAAGGRVGHAAELAAGVQPRHDELDAGQARLRLQVDGDAAAVVAHLEGAVGVQRHADVGAVAGEGLVDAVVDDLPQAVREATAVGRPDVHAGSLAHGLQPLQHREVPGGVAVRVFGCRFGGRGGQRACAPRG
ncbi:hypothetical protein GCM10023178_53120 [Actinomadura luteofluorescens]